MKRYGRLLFLSLSLVAASSPGPLLLREAADGADLLIGSAVRYALSDAAYSRTLGRQFNMVEPEDSMKWRVLRRNEGAFDFAEGDAIVRFAHAHRMKVRGHCLVWDHDNPEWLTPAQFTQAALARLLKEHITIVMQHYAGQVFAWDVVNEAFEQDGKLKDSPWYNQPGIGLAQQGTAYIERTFHWAHAGDPSAVLFYNEGGAEAMNTKSDAVYAMVKDFKHRGVPIDGVGLQMHISRFDFDANAVAANIARLTALGLQVDITELDVSLPLEPGGAPRPEDLQQQADIYRRVVHTCLQNRGCTAVQTWGFTDKYSWITSHTHGSEGAALLFDKNYQPKPAYSSLLAEISSWPERAR